MEITRRTDYAIRLLQELDRRGGGPVSVRELAERQAVPYAFARAVQRDLVAAGLVTTVRGRSGGCVLVRDSESITLLDIVSAIQGEPAASVCSRDPQWCAQSGGCSVHRVWCELDAITREFLGRKTLAGLNADVGK